MPAPPVWVRIGTLDRATVDLACQVLLETAALTGTSLVVDLKQLDEEHGPTVFALLLEAARVVGQHGGTVTVLRPPHQLIAGLRTSDITVIPFGPAPQMPSGTRIMNVGVAHPAALRY